MNSLLILITGFVFGLKHALEADHVLTVTTLIRKVRFFRTSAILALLWGLGHTLILLVVGALVLTLKLNIPRELGLLFESVVGIVLVVMGVQVLLKLTKDKIHLHSHEHDQVHKHKPLLLGMLHGLSGSAALTILVLASVPSLTLGMLYILVFGIGSIVGMIIVSSMISLPFLFFKNETRMGLALNAAVGTSSLLLGIFIVYKASQLFN